MAMEYTQIFPVSKWYICYWVLCVSSGLWIKTMILESGWMSVRATFPVFKLYFWKFEFNCCQPKFSFYFKKWKPKFSFTFVFDKKNHW